MLSLHPPMELVRWWHAKQRSCRVLSLMNLMRLNHAVFVYKECVWIRYAEEFFLPYNHTCFVFVSAYAPIISICMHKILFVISFFCICIRMAGINCTILLFVYTYYISYGMPHFMFQLISAAILSEVQGVRSAGNSDFQCRSWPRCLFAQSCLVPKSHTAWPTPR